MPVFDLLTSDGSTLPEVFAAQVLFWLLLPVVLFARPRWSMLAWLVMSNLDASNPGQTISSTGWVNAVKSLALPVLLIWRFRDVEGLIPKTLVARLWIALTIYAAVSTLWSPFPLAAYKLVGNMVGIFLAFIVIEKAARKGLLDRTSLLILLISSLILAAVQTYYYGGASYGFDGVDQPSRLSSFISAQQYAALLVAFLCLILWLPSFGMVARTSGGAILLVALALNGSRVWFFGAVLIVAMFLFLSFRQATVVGALLTATIASFILFTFSLVSGDDLNFDESTNRIVATVSAITTGVDTSQRVGLRDLSFRTAIYSGLINDIQESKVVEIALGHGTSSGANGVMRVFPNSYDPEHLDPNRIVHNEWLRALYEWGLFGFLLLVSVFVSLAASLISVLRAKVSGRNALAALSFLPAFLLAFSSENIIAGAGNAVTISLALMIGLLWAPRPGKVTSAFA